MTSRTAVKKKVGHPLEDQGGSVLLIAMMLLFIMSIIGFYASRTAITESFILRNTAIHNQNIGLVESAAMEIAQRALIDLPEPAAPYLSEISPIRLPYVVSLSDWNDAIANGGTSKRDTWYDTGSGGSGRVLSGVGAAITDSLGITWTGSNTFSPTECQWVQPECATDMNLIDTIRGENSDSPLRVALVGWEAAPGASLKGTKATRKRGAIMAEYVSPDYGLMRLEVGIEREF
jgi:hypothetical protein